MKHKYSFDEFKLMYESTEKVTDRRLATNRWNYTICTAILIALSTVLKFSIENIKIYYIGISFSLVLSMMAIFFCYLWIGQIKDFKILNTAKYEVLNEMAPCLEYDTEHQNVYTPYCPFEKEWKKVEKMNGLQDKASSNIISLKSTNSEYYIPKAFLALFIIISLLSIFLYFPLSRTILVNPTTENNVTLTLK